MRLSIHQMSCLLAQADARHSGCMVEFFHELETRTNRPAVRGRVTWGMRSTQQEFYSVDELEKILQELISSPRRKK